MHTAVQVDAQSKKHISEHRHLPWSDAKLQVKKERTEGETKKKKKNTCPCHVKENQVSEMRNKKRKEKPQVKPN